ncbi:hypothetical protein MMC26_002646 [Xylographa opegraphella]|nr:hypothetical protein [Xylographa opegraphella]
MSDPASIELVSRYATPYPALIRIRDTSMPGGGLAADSQQNRRSTKRKWNFVIFEDPETDPPSPTPSEESYDNRDAQQSLNPSSADVPTTQLRPLLPNSSPSESSALDQGPTERHPADEERGTEFRFTEFRSTGFSYISTGFSYISTGFITSPPASVTSSSASVTSPPASDSSPPASDSYPPASDPSTPASDLPRPVSNPPISDLLSSDLHSSDPPDQDSVSLYSPSQQTSSESNSSSLNMPYNNTAIPPSDEVTGTAALPLARVKKILQADEEIGPVSNNAAFVITLATEMFVRYLAEQAHNVAKSESKPRRSIQYRDVSNAVARLDNLEFLSDIIPRTTTWREHKAKKARESGEPSTRRSRPLAPGQTTLDGTDPLPGDDHPMGEVVPEVDEDGILSSEEHPSRPVIAQSASESEATNGTSGLVSEHHAPNGDGRPEESDDIEMT